MYVAGQMVERGNPAGSESTVRLLPWPVHIAFKIMFLGCVIGRRGITIQLPSSGLAKNIILNTIVPPFLERFTVTCAVSINTPGVDALSIHKNDDFFPSFSDNPILKEKRLNINRIQPDLTAINLHPRPDLSLRETISISQLKDLH